MQSLPPIKQPRLDRIADRRVRDGEPLDAPALPGHQHHRIPCVVGAHLVALDFDDSQSGRRAGPECGDRLVSELEAVDDRAAKVLDVRADRPHRITHRAHSERCRLCAARMAPCAIGDHRNARLVTQRNHRRGVLVRSVPSGLRNAQHDGFAAPELEALASCHVHIRQDVGLTHGVALRLRVDPRSARGATAWNARCICTPSRNRLRS